MPQAEIKTMRPPQAGDYSICFGCTTILMFDAQLQLRRLTDAELAAVPPDCRRAQQTLRRFKQRRR